MNDILPPINMNFNPFRSTSQPTDNVPNPTTIAHGNGPSNASFLSDDSWHSNIPASNRIENKAVAAAPTSAPLPWFSSWTTSSTTSTTTNAVSSSTAGTAANTTITSQQISSVQTTVLAPPNNTRHDLPRSPSSFNMLRGVESHESEDANRPSPTNHQSASRNRYNTHYLARGESFGARVKNAIIGANAGGGCMPTAIPTANHGGGDDLYSIIADVPFFPPQNRDPSESPRALQNVTRQQHAAIKSGAVILCSALFFCGWLDRVLEGFKRPLSCT